MYITCFDYQGVRLFSIYGVTHFLKYKNKAYISAKTLIGSFLAA